MKTAYLLKALRAMNVAREAQEKGDAFGAKWFGNLSSFYLRLSDACID